MLSQACIAIVLPITIGCIFYLTSKKALMNVHVNKKIDIVLFSIILFFSIYVSSLGIKGLIIDLVTI
jgi:Mn2+/Fe2+ NRAMP family transporter